MGGTLSIYSGEMGRRSQFFLFLILAKDDTNFSVSCQMHEVRTCWAIPKLIDNLIRIDLKNEIFKYKIVKIASDTCPYDSWTRYFTSNWLDTKFETKENE